jgi:3-oxosteroid 1-dehydrogenase
VGEYPNLVLAQIWDQRSQDHSASTEYGRLIVPPGTDDSHVIKGETPEELTRGIDERLARYTSLTGGLRLAPSFLADLKETLRRFNVMAHDGADRDFHRGERAVQLLFNGTVKEEPGRTNPTLGPLSDTRPYYAALVTGGTLDTKAGRKRHRTDRSSTTWTSRYQGFTASATAWPQPLLRRTGQGERRSDRSSRSRTAPPMPNP